MQEVGGRKQGLYYVLTDLMLSSLLALIYTNDLFTAYVFVEINTISACGLDYDKAKTGGPSKRRYAI